MTTKKTKATSKPDAGKEQAGQTRKPRRSKTADEDERRLTVVGIGASAGGLQALQALFDNLAPDTGMAFVIVTHMHPEHESHLAELLQAHTSMDVQQVQETTPVRSNHVYVMPPNWQVLITDAHLDLGKFEGPRGRRTPIDGFFRSLAATHRDAVAVILSGSRTDGSVGLKDVKENGGLILVQSPVEAEYDGMPRAAITTGLADLVLPVAQLAGKLVDYTQQRPILPQDPDQLTERQQSTIDRILAQVHARTGNDFGQYKRSTILRRIQRRMQLNGFTTLEAYLEYMRQQSGEATAMFNDILIGVTNFFRDRASWKALAELVIPTLFEDRSNGTGIRVWSIGCATGEEAYGLAMLLLEHASHMGKHYDMQVFASDLAETALAQAREGLYPTAIEADVSPERLERFFTQEGNHYRVKRELRDMVLFTSHNILRDPPFSHIDLIVCRNLLIYLRREVQDNIFEIFHYALNPGGFLFLGTSESADAMPLLFSNIDKTHRIYRARPWRGDQPHLPSLPLSAVRTNRRELPRLRTAASQKAGRETQGEHETALEESSPPNVLIDEHGNLLHVSETAGKFLLQRKGQPTRELLKLIRPELQAELQSALIHAFERDQAVITMPTWVRFNGFAHRVVVAIRPSKADEAAERQALVFFLEDEVSQPIEAMDASQQLPEPATTIQVNQLQTEIRRLREQLQITVEEYNSSNEEMKASNEELQSINEEYRSTTEELETSREELQSVNEELQTVNNELKNKLEEISKANSDLENFMAASEIATLFLTRDLQIKRFTEGMDEVLDLIPADMGRPIAHFANKLGYEELVEDAGLVLHKLLPLERELQNKAGRWYLVRIRPYRTVDHKIDGVVLTFVDITELKEAQRALQEMNETLHLRVDERTNALHQANQSLTAVNQLFTTLFQFNPIPTALNRLKDWVFINVNQAYLDYFGVESRKVIGKSANTFGFAPDRELRKRIQAELEKNGVIYNLELTFRGPSGDMRTVLGSMQRVEVENEAQVISSFIDITERAKAEQQIRELASQLTMAEQREQHRISQVLHNELQQRLFALRMQLTFLREAWESGTLDSFKVDLPQIENGVAEAIEVTRDLSMELSPAVLRGEGLVEAIKWLATQMEEKFGLDVKVRASGPAIGLDESMRTLLYQSIHELLFNVVKHAGIKKAEVNVQQHPDRIHLSVIDHGNGFDPAILTTTMGMHGLHNTQNKLALLRCSTQINSRPGNGTKVVIEVPISQAKE